MGLGSESFWGEYIQKWLQRAWVTSESIFGRVQKSVFEMRPVYKDLINAVMISELATNCRKFAADANLDIRTSFFDQLVQTVEIVRPSDPAAQDFSMPPLPWATRNGWI